MPLRSSSTPILNSWIPHHHYSTSASLSPDHHNSNNNNHHHYNSLHLHLPRTNSISAFTTPSLSPTAADRPKFASCPLSGDHPAATTPTPLQRLFSSSGLDEAVDDEGGNPELSALVEGCGGGAAGGGFNDNNNNDNDDCNSNNSSDHGHGGSIEEYYGKMIEANPANPLLLGNYAKFLKEVRGDMVKAEEYCGRAIVASPSDANMLALYADIIWQTQKDAQRAESYFDQAVQSAPHDSYVLASYAKFLWDTEEEEEGEEKKNEKTDTWIPSVPKYLEETSHRSPLAAA